jgi:DNA repair exonuclease SbcCD ATPase subunit
MEVAAAFQKNRADELDARIAELETDQDELAALREAVVGYRAEIAALRVACDNWYQRATAAEALVRAGAVTE